MQILRSVLWVMVCAGWVVAAGAGEIHSAIEAGDAARVAALLRADPSLVNAKNENQTQDLPLHTAALAGQLEIARILLDAGADIDGFDVDESTPLHDAALRRQREMVDFLISRGADVNRRDRNGAYALSFAVSGGDSVVTRHILDAGADLNLTTTGGVTLMHYAVSRGFWDLVDRLVARGGDVNVANGAGQTPMHWLGYGNNAQRVLRAISYGASATVADTSGQTPLHLAAERGNLEVTRVMIENGADIQATDHYGWSPLAAALVGGNEELVGYLLERGADPNLSIWQGTPILFLPVRQGKTALVQAMIDHGAQATRRSTSFNSSLLHLAAEFGYADMATIALTHGCDVAGRDSLGRTAMDVAARYGHPAVAQLLRQYGAEGTAPVTACTAPAGDAPRANEAQIWYLGHSGWAIETANHFLIFDYFTDPRLPDDPNLCNGNIVPAALAGKNVTVFASHEHQDHYHAPMFEWRAQIPHITYVLGFNPPGATGYEYVPPRETRNIGGVKVTAIPANDSGEGFWVEVDGLTFFHAGDHACRTRDLSGNYTPEIKFLAARGVRPDIAFLPISGCNFGDQVAVKTGTEYTLSTLAPKLFLPMHAGRQTTNRYRDFIRDCGDRFPQTRMVTLYCAGDHLSYKNGRIVS